MHPEPERLAQVPLFASLSPEQLQALARFTTVRQEDAGTCLIAEEAPGFAFFVLEQGTATVTSGTHELGVLGAGDFFGEIALLTDRGRTATVTAASAVSLIVMLGRDLQMFGRDFPEASEQLKRAVAERLERSAELGRA
jgi:CRP-like cAMP-binding protein